MKKLSIILAMILLGACTPKKSSVKSVTPGGTSPTIAGVNTGTQCAGNTASSSVGSIFDPVYPNMGSITMASKVSLLLGEHINYLVSGPNAPSGVTFSGSIKLDGSGNVVGSQSNLTILIYDDVWMMNPTDANLIHVSFSPSAGAEISGTFNTQTGAGTLLLKDQYGQVSFEGVINAQTFSGTVKFANQGSATADTLGQFQIQRCGIIK